MTIRAKETKNEFGRYHSFNDEPAVIRSDGNMFWYHHGKLHRENDPAIIYSNGDKEWFIHGELHREDGPAIEYSNGNKSWYINGTKYTFHNWLKLSSLSEEEKTELLLSHV